MGGSGTTRDLRMVCSPYRKGPSNHIGHVPAAMEQRETGAHRCNSAVAEHCTSRPMLIHVMLAASAAYGAIFATFLHFGASIELRGKEFAVTRVYRNAQAWIWSVAVDTMMQRWLRR